MKHFLSSMLLLTVLSSTALGDGYPFDSSSQRVTRDSLRLKLTPEQINEVSATGTVTFSGKNLSYIRLLYPAANNRVDVITATWNDSLENLTAEDVYCLWVAPDEVAITINDNHPKEKNPFPATTNGVFPTDEELGNISHRFLRIHPDGGIFYRGKLISLERAFALIDGLDPAAPEGSVLNVTLPPPAGYGDDWENEDGPPGPQRIFRSLELYGKSRKIGVQPYW